MAKAHSDLVKKGLLELQRLFPSGRFWPVNTGRLYARTKTGLRPVRVNVNGIPDIDGYIPILGLAVRVGCEAKVGKDRLRKSQIVYQGELELAGGLYVEFHSAEELGDRMTDAVLRAITRSRVSTYR